MVGAYRTNAQWLRDEARADVEWWLGRQKDRSMTSLHAKLLRYAEQEDNVHARVEYLRLARLLSDAPTKVPMCKWLVMKQPLRPVDVKVRKDERLMDSIAVEVFNPAKDADESRDLTAVEKALGRLAPGTYVIRILKPNGEYMRDESIDFEDELRQFRGAWED
jgi:hypothetical protein